MIQKKKLMFYVFNLCLVLFLWGCVSTGGKYSGFLGNYSQMRQSPKMNGLYLFKHPTQGLQNYTKVIITYPQMYFHRDFAGYGVNSQKMIEFAEFFQGYAMGIIGKDYDIVQKPQAGTLIIRSAITNVILEKPLSDVHRAMVVPGLGLGEASMEAEFIDAVTGERVGAVMVSHQEDQSNTMKGPVEWGETRNVLKKWVRLLKSQLDEGRNSLHD